MNPDPDLLRLYADNRSEGAFAELVGRHVKMVYSCALRRVGHDAHLAEDVTQIVFNDLARKARHLAGRPTVAGWLYVSTQLASAAIVRREQRRRFRESEASEAHGSPANHGNAPGVDWARARPILDLLILDLRREDRDAVVLRFFEQRPFSEIAVALKSTEEATRKRVGRAVEKLRTQLERRGIMSATDALEFALADPSDAHQGEHQNPARVAAIAVSEFAATGAATTFLLSLARILTSEIILSGCVVLGIALLLAHQARLNSGLKTEIARSSGHVEAVRGLKRDDESLEQEIRQLSDRARSRSVASLTQSGQAADGRVRNAVSLNLSVTPEGTLTWENEPVTLEGFLDRLVAYRTQHPGGDAQVIVHGAAGAAFSATAYVVEQASRAGIQDIIVDSPSRPTPSDVWTFSPQTRSVGENDLSPPSLPDPQTKP